MATISRREQRPLSSFTNVAKTLSLLAAALACWMAGTPTHAQAAETRRAMLESCASDARDRKLSGDEHAAFMRSCLKAPEGAKAPVFGASEAQPATGAALKPALTAPQETATTSEKSGKSTASNKTDKRSATR